MSSTFRVAMSGHASVMPRMSNTAEILTKQFRENIRRASIPSVTDEPGDQRWSWQRFKQEFLNLTPSSEDQSGGSLHHQQQVNELFPKYLTRLQHNFFVSLLLLNIFFNSVVIVVALVRQCDAKYPGIIFLNCTSLVIFAMFLYIAYIDEHLLRPKFSRSLASITVLMTMIFTEYGNELLQLHHFSTYLLQRIRPTIYIVIGNHILLPFATRLGALFSSLIIIGLELAISLHQRLNVCPNHVLVVRLTIAEAFSYFYAALFGYYMSRLLEIIIRRAFVNHHKYTESKFNIYQEQEHQEQLLNSCFPRHLIEDVRKDLKEMIRVLDRQEKILQRPFKKLYVKKYDNVSILYADIVNSMLLTSALSANDLVETLNDMFGRFDECAEKNNCLRIKLLGDCYYCVSGVPNNDAKHAVNCVQMGLDMIEIIRQVRRAKDININMRIGIHSGMVLSGIIGVHKWQFDIWSEDSLLASAMEHDGVPGCVHITQETLDLLPENLLRNYQVETKLTNERIGYVISKQEEQHETNMHCDGKRKQTERLKENVYKLRRRSSFSTIRSRSASSIQEIQESSMIEKYLTMKRQVNEFIDQEIEQMPLSFKSNFKNHHGINPMLLTFQQPKRRKSSVNKTRSGSEVHHLDEEESQDMQDTWQLEREFLHLHDDFFVFYLFFSLVLAIVVGVVKYAIVPHVNISTLSMLIQIITILLILGTIYYSFKFSHNLSFWKRNVIWFLVAIFLLVCSLHDIILCNCGEVDENIFQELQLLNSPYLWSYTMCAILSMTGVSIFIRINLWLKLILRLVGLAVFTAILLSHCSLYRVLLPHTRGEKDDQEWISSIGFDPIFSHFYYLFMIVIILTIIDRQIEYIFRLDFKLAKRLKREKQEAKMMGEINEILLKNILPSYVVQRYLNNSFAFTDQLYSESYRFCAVMFASIPNYSEFYSENKLNDNGRKCLQILNEIICDFDQLLSHTRFQKIEKIKTIGSTYMAAAGLQPGRGSDDTDNSAEDERNHVMNLLHFAMALMETLKSINLDALQDFKLRIGIAVGPVIAGIVGASKPQYDIWGDTVNVASRMESTGVVGRIQITLETAKIVSTVNSYTDHFTLEQRGPIQVKGKGSLITYLVKSKYDFEENEITKV